jgi:hypothetical protein
MNQTVLVNLYHYGALDVWEYITPKQLEFLNATNPLLNTWTNVSLPFRTLCKNVIMKNESNNQSIIDVLETYVCFDDILYEYLHLIS